MTSNPWMKFYPADWRSDPALRMCSLAARGLWMEMLAVMHEAEPRGHLLVNGRMVTSQQMAALSGVELATVQTAMGELEDAGVFSRKRNGVIFSRRMEKDEQRARKNRDNGKLGGNPTLCNSSDNEQSDNQNSIISQKPEARSQKPELENKPLAQQHNAPPAHLLDKLLAAAGLGDAGLEKHSGLLRLDAILGMIDAGYDLETEILPPIRAVAARGGKPPKSWSYYVEPIKDAVSLRRSLADVRKAAPEPMADDKWRACLELFKTGTWHRGWGPKPGEPDCRVPAHLLLELNAA